MNPAQLMPVVTAVGAVLGVIVALWTMFAHFDKRNADRFDGLRNEVAATRDGLQKEVVSTKEVLRAEMKEMRAELRLEIREAGDRRVSVK